LTSLENIYNQECLKGFEVVFTFTIESMSSHDVSTPMVDLRQEGKSRFTTPALVYKRILEEIMTNK